MSRLPILQPGPASPLPAALRGDGRSVYFASLGCPKNRTDSEVMLAKLGQAGYEMADDPDAAELIIVNTCTFVDDATKESVDTILELGGRKKAGARLIVSGCMAQRHHADLKAEMPEVDAFVGTGDYHRILDVVGEGGSDIVGLPVYVQGREPRVNTLTPWSAYLKILEGCPQRCSFCIIPKLRGDLMSRPLGVIVEEARLLAAAGVKELNLVGQDSNSWGRDLGDDRLPDLLAALNDVPGIAWIRLLYSYPAKFDDRLIDTMASLPKVLPYVDMPLQHVSDPILKSMRRGVSKDRTRRLLDKLRDRMPDLAVRTGFIVGYPGETEAQFRELLEFVTEQRFDNLGVFTFSPQDGTPAADLVDDVPARVKKARRDVLMKTQQKIAFRKNEERVGTVIPVLLEGVHEETELLWKGRARFQAPDIDGMVFVNDGNGAAFGDIVDVEITEMAGYDLVGGVVAG